MVISLASRTLTLNSALSPKTIVVGLISNCRIPPSRNVGVGAGVAVGLGLGGRDGEGLGNTTGVACGDGAIVGYGVGAGELKVGEGVGIGVGATVGVEVANKEGVGSAVDIGLAYGDAIGEAEGVGEGSGSGSGVGLNADAIVGKIAQMISANTTANNPLVLKRNPNGVNNARCNHSGSIFFRKSIQGLGRRNRLNGLSRRLRARLATSSGKESTSS